MAIKKYVIIALNEITIKLQYKFNSFVGIFLRFAQLSMLYYIWNGIYNSTKTGKIGNYTKKEMLIYIVLINLTVALFSSSYMMELGKMIHNGKLTTLLLRPINLLGESFAKYTGRKLFLIIIYLSALIFSRFTGFFKSPVYFLVMLIFIILSYIMFFYMISFMSTVGFWLIDVWPLSGVVNGIYLLLSGIYFPLDLLPKGLYNIIKYNPFAIVGYASIHGLQGMFAEKEVLFYIIAIIVWIFIFRTAYCYAFTKGLRKYEGMGA